MKSSPWCLPLLALCLAPVLSTALTAQATLTVGPGGFAQIVDAIAAAQAGDLIVVQAGTYLPFDVPLGVRIVAPDGAIVTTSPGGPASIYNVAPPAGQQATIVGLTFRTNPIYPPPEPTVSLHVTGNVVFADCLFYNWADLGYYAVVCNGDVQFDRCEWNGLWDGMSVIGGRVVANHCLFRAYRNSTYGGWMAICILASAGTIRLNFCDLKGSDGGTQSLIGSPAVHLSGTAQLEVSDSTVTGGDSQYPVSTAIDNDSAFPVLHTRSTIQGSYGLLTMNPPTYGYGPAFDGPEQAATLIGGVADPAGPRVGVGYQGWVLAPTSGFAGTVLSFQRTPALTVPFASDPIHFDPAAAFVASVGQPIPGTPWPGVGIHFWQVVPLPAALYGEQVWLHAVYWDGSMIHVGPTFGGLVY